MTTALDERPSTAPSQRHSPEPAVRPPEHLGEIAAALLDRLGQEDLVWLAADEVEGRELFRAVQAGAPEALVVFVPPSDSLPGDSAPPTPGNAGERTAALRRVRAALAEKKRPRIVLISTGEAAARLTAPPDSFGTAPPVLEVGQPVDLEQLSGILEELGYLTDDRVDEPGEIGPRGQVLDLFPADAGQPYRVEVQDGCIAAIRAYDPITQLTTGDCERLEVGRVTEPPIGDGATLVDHLPGAAVGQAPKADARRRRFLALAEDAARRRPKRALRDICPDARWSEALASHPPLELGEAFAEPPPRFVELRSPERAFLKAARAALSLGERLVLLGSERDLRFIVPRAARALGVDPVPAGSWSEVRAAGGAELVTLTMPLARGFRMEGLLAVAAADLLGSRAQRDSDPAAAGDAALLDSAEVRIGDVVVHEDHGIALVAGLQQLPDGGGEAIVLRFAGDARRLVPVSEAHRLWRYGADEEAVALDKLDGSSWAKRREEILASIAETARALVALAAERMNGEAPVLDPDPAAYERFAGGFPFTETADQTRAIEAVRADLASGKPMDRLVIGDVGYGKTEVALRAAAIAALSGRQVAVAAPTTVLARQHLESFRDRFAELGVEVAGLSRLSSAAERKKVVAGLKDGSIRVVVGTGAVAGKAIAYADLALVIIDEEQRFGARDKARLRDLSAGHVLSLSATPIPRTLQSALVGLQQLSVIATPPARRQPIRTTVASFDEAQVRTALMRERSRGGQSFVVVPRIDDMEAMAARIARLAPELELLQAHGKLPAAEIDETMVRFAAGEGDVLLATNIIEAGLDVPRANTMIVWRADRFGLSQLHQLRGRVGRGARRGQIFLLTEEGAQVAPRTLARLNTLAAFDRLGAGFAISARDLDLRGAGDMLSDAQSGHLKLIGVDLYQHLLQRALREARGEEVEDWTPVLNLGTGGSLPAEWIPDEETRVGLYVRFARLADVRSLEAFEQELADRFGELPDDAQTLLGNARVRVLARDAGVAKIDAGPAAIAFSFRPGAAPPRGSAGLEEKDGRYLLKDGIDEAARRLERVEEVLAELS